MTDAIFQVELLTPESPIPNMGSGDLDETKYYEDSPEWMEYAENLSEKIQNECLQSFKADYPYLICVDGHINVFKITNENAIMYFSENYTEFLLAVEEAKLYPEKFTQDPNFSRKLKRLIENDLDVHIYNKSFGTITLDDFMRRYRGKFAITKAVGYKW